MFIVGISSTIHAAIHAPGSAAHTEAYARCEAFASIGAPFMRDGTKVQIRMRAASSAMPAPRTYAGLQTHNRKIL